MATDEPTPSAVQAHRQVRRPRILRGIAFPFFNRGFCAQGEAGEPSRLVPSLPTPLRVLPAPFPSCERAPGIGAGPACMLLLL